MDFAKELAFTLAKYYILCRLVDGLPLIFIAQQRKRIVRICLIFEALQTLSTVVDFLSSYEGF